MKLEKIICKFWNSFLGFGSVPNAGDINSFAHVQKSGLKDNEINILKYSGKGEIISLPNKYYTLLNEFIKKDKFNLIKLKRYFEEISSKKGKIYGPVESFYLFDKNNLFEKSLDVRIMEGDSDKIIFSKFMDSCIDDKNKVDILFGDVDHRIFGLFKGNKVVSIGNYSIDRETCIAHIGIITNGLHKGKGYGKELVNTIVLDILNENLIPQYRVNSDNIASKSIAKSLGFTKVLEGISIIIE